MFKNTNQISIIADYREAPSGIPLKLTELGINIETKSLLRGDYIINQQIIVERKSKEDFVISLIQNRLFKQVANLKKNKDYRPILLIEGNPYSTKHDIAREAIKGALLSITVSWHIPIIYSANTKDSAQMLIMAAKQNLQENFSFHRAGYLPKSMAKKQVYFLQGLPDIGPKLANSLIKQFGTIKKIIVASEKQLLKVEGIGKGKATKIREFIVFQRNNKE
jgi:Fanconi anemia group M protein